MSDAAAQCAIANDTSRPLAERQAAKDQAYILWNEVLALGHGAPARFAPIVDDFATKCVP